MPWEPWGKDVFAKIERAGGVQLNAEQRRDLENYVHMYVVLLENSENIGGEVRFNALHKKWLDRLIRNLNETILTLEEPSGLQFKVFWNAGLLSEPTLEPAANDIARLKALRDSCVEEREELGRPGAKPHSLLHKILGKLERIFRDARGKVAISRANEDELRESPFIDFAWESLLQAPEQMRPRTRQALAVAWERHRLPVASK